MVYGQREYNCANDLYKGLQNASGIFGIVVEEPQWVEVPDSRNANDYIKAIMSDVNAKTCKIVCVILFNPDLKKGIKAFLDKGGVPS